MMLEKMSIVMPLICNKNSYMGYVFYFVNRKMVMSIRYGHFLFILLNNVDNRVCPIVLAHGILIL